MNKKLRAQGLFFNKNGSRLKPGMSQRKAK